VASPGDAFFVEGEAGGGGEGGLEGVPRGEDGKGRSEV